MITRGDGVALSVKCRERKLAEGAAKAEWATDWLTTRIPKPIGNCK